jgi:hypothetical protein
MTPINQTPEGLLTRRPLRISTRNEKRLFYSLLRGDREEAKDRRTLQSVYDSLKIRQRPINTKMVA